ncbi:MAG: glycosyltransferase [Bacteroidales bacterium]|jgi:glycosyltransferase involved in cell wall biosynthesis|nr:glycosyltransferase [Bacteroidales bacterium]
MKNNPFPNYSTISPIIINVALGKESESDLAEILVITSYPPRECGIATYSQDLIKVLKNQFSTSFSVKVCALEAGCATHIYPDEVLYILDTTNANEFSKLADIINQNNKIKIVLIQHEFGFFHDQENAFLQFMVEVNKPISIVFHSVLPYPEEMLRAKVRKISSVCDSIIVMTKHSSEILVTDYGINPEKISVIAHGTHLIAPVNKEFFKEKYGLKDRKVLTTFGLLSSGKSIETTLHALPEIIKTSPNVIFLIIGITHPEVVKNEGEKYREMLEGTVTTLGIQHHVRFINSYLALPILLEYLQLTDIYLFTTNDPNQAVSGTFAYAMSCACPIISTPIPHAKEFLSKDTGIIFDFKNTQQLAASVKSLLDNDILCKNISLNTLQKIISTAWENSAIAHARVFEKISGKKIIPKYSLPPINLEHLKKMTDAMGIIQFSKINQPDLSTGYTLDDNARALIAMCMHYELTGDNDDLTYIQRYFNFIKYCMKPSGYFENYVGEKRDFTEQNRETNLDDPNGRAIWALGYVISLTGLLPQIITSEAECIMEKSLRYFEKVYSTRSMAFAIKGIYYSQNAISSPENLQLLKTFANRLVQMYKHEAREKWEWFESYLTYANSLLPEAMLNAWLLTGDPIYKEIAIDSFNFLLSKIFNQNGIEVISNKKWLQKGQESEPFGEQPIDVAYTILTLSKFYDVFQHEEYREKMGTAFNWFLGKNRLNQIIYNPCTGGCYDGLEEHNVNLNQGAESTVSYLMARLSIEKYKIALNI